MYDFICKNCGKKHTRATQNAPNQKFCDRNCWSEYNKKKMQAEAEAKKQEQLERRKRRTTITPASQCEKCIYGYSIASVWCCGHFEIAGYTRHSLHPEGLPAECQEYQPKKGARKKRSPKIK
jgi:hypothetical protein